MPSNSLHSPLSSDEFPEGDANEDAYNNEQRDNEHKKSKHRKHGKHKSKKHKKHRSAQSGLDDAESSSASKSHRKHKSSKHHYENDELIPPPPMYFEPKPQVNKPIVGYEDLSDTELSFKDERVVPDHSSSIAENKKRKLSFSFVHDSPIDNFITTKLPETSPLSSSSLDADLKSSPPAIKNDRNNEVDVYEDFLKDAPELDEDPSAVRKTKHKHSKHKHHRKHGCKKRKKGHSERHSDSDPDIPAKRSRSREDLVDDLKRYPACPNNHHHRLFILRPFPSQN